MMDDLDATVASQLNAITDWNIDHYTLDFLLAKLPTYGRITIKRREQSSEWYAKWDNRRVEKYATADNLVDSVGRLLVELADQGIVS